MACLATSTLQPRVIRSGARQPRRQAAVATASSLRDPYSVLGVSATADEAEIKKAYRTKAKQWHPDVAKTEGSSMVFLQLTEAYDFLLGRMRGDRGESKQSGDWDWHDWYWNFRISRTWGKQQQGASAAPPPNSKAAVSSAPNLKEQLAGLRHRAAIRATKARSGGCGSMSTVDTCSTMDSCGTMDEDEEVEGEGRVHFSGHAQVHVQAHAADGAAHAAHQHQQHHYQHHHQQQQVAGEEGEEEPQVHAAGAAGQRRKFVAHSGTRDAVRNQLAGLRRKSMMAADVR